MSTDMMFQNVFTFFIVGFILEASVMAIFSISAVKNITNSQVGESVRDGAILVLSIFICWKVDAMSLFRGTGIYLPSPLNFLISGLVLSRITILIREFFARIRND